MTPNVRQVVVGRQPIVAPDGAVYGYELLYRPVAGRPIARDGDEMTVEVLFGALSLGLQNLSGSAVLFCNAERSLLTGETPIALPPERTVLEVIETVEIDDAVLAGCRDLVERGYRLALDDWDGTTGGELLELVSIIKIDVLASGRERAEELLGLAARDGVLVVAEKVETADDVRWAVEAGFALLQGYGVERPQCLDGRTVPASTPTRLQLAVSLLGEELDVDELESLVRREPGLLVQLLQLASYGSARGLKRPVRTAREALVVLGSVKAQQWLGVVLIASACDDALSWQLVDVLHLARTCELVATHELPETGELAFTAAMLSAVPGLLGSDPDDLAGSLELDEELKQAAFGHGGPVGRLVEEVSAYHRAMPEQGTATEREELLALMSERALRWTLPLADALDRAAEVA